MKVYKNQSPTERRQAILLYLETNEFATTGQMVEAFGIARSTLGSDISILKSQGNTIISPKKGVYKLESRGKYHEEISDATIRSWIVLYCFYMKQAVGAKKCFALDEISDFVMNITGIPKPAASTLQRDLDKIVAAGLIDKERSKSSSRYLYSLNSNSPVTISFFELGKLYDFLIKYEQNECFSPLEQDIKAIYEKIRPIIEVSEDDQEKDFGNSRIIHGKYNSMQSHSKEVLHSLLNMDYLKYQVRIVRNNNQCLEKMNICTKCIIYSIQKNECYLIGIRNYRQKREALVSIPLNTIDAVTITAVPNEIGASKETEEAVQQMFDVSVEPLRKIRVRFDNRPYIRDKIDRYCAFRRSARIIEGTVEHFILEDRISGMNDFACYLRQFGRAAEILEPESLRRSLRRTAIRSINEYKESLSI